MVTAKTQYNLKNAEEYFEEHLAVGDYYDEGQRVAGEWIGLGAQRLDLSGKVRADDFLSLCENQHPASHHRDVSLHKGRDAQFHGNLRSRNSLGTGLWHDASEICARHPAGAARRGLHECEVLVFCSLRYSLSFSQLEQRFSSQDRRGEGGRFTINDDDFVYSRPHHDRVADSGGDKQCTNKGQGAESQSALRIKAN
jgi:hypothetical protein